MMEPDDTVRRFRALGVEANGFRESCGRIRSGWVGAARVARVECARAEEMAA
jgi:hypothetical protein